MDPIGARWEGLFADLEAQLSAAAIADRAAEAEARARVEAGQISIVDRLRAAIGEDVRVRCSGGLLLRGRLLRVGPEWLLLEELNRQEIVVPVAAICSTTGHGRLSAGPERGSAVSSRLGLRSALRAVSRDRAQVTVYLVDGSSVDGTLDRVGADFADLAVHPVGEARRRGDVLAIQTLILGMIAAVRRRS